MTQREKCAHPQSKCAHCCLLAYACAAQKKEGFISTLCLALESQRLSNATMSAEASLQRGLLQVLELSMFQLSDKQAGDAQSRPFHSYAL